MQQALPALLTWLQSLPPELIWPLMLAFSFGALTVMHRLWGESGLHAYIVTAILAANIQVLKAVKFSVYPEPVAAGTIIFASTYVATDILTECYGPKAGRRGVLIGFASYLVFTVVMILTLGYSPLTPEQAGESMAWALPYQGHLEALFLPSPGLFLAGMIAYLVSQLNDVWVFQRLRQATGGKKLWLRAQLSTAFSALLDNTVFSILAWIVFSPNPLPWGTVVVVYILGTYWLRLVLSVVEVPFVYLARRWRPAVP